MNKNISRREALKVIGLAGTSAVMAACGPKTITEPTKAPEATKVPEATKAPVVPVKLRYIQHWHTNDSHSRAMDIVFKSWNEKNPDIQVQLQDFAAADSMPKQQADCTAGDCPDIMHEADIIKWDSGWLLDLTPYVTGAWKDRLIPASLEPLTTDDGKLFALPMEYSPLLNLWNTEIIEGQLGLKVPTTWEEFIALGEAAKAKGIPLTLPNISLLHIGTNIVFSTPGTAEALAKGQWDNDGTRKVATMIKEMWDNKLMPEGSIDLDWPTSINVFQQKKAVMFADGAWTIGNNIFVGGEDKFGLAKNLTITPSLKFAGGLGTAAWIYSGGVGLAAALAKDQNRLQAALKVMDFWTSADMAYKWLETGASPLGVKLEKFPENQPLLSQYAGVKADLLYSGKSAGKVIFAHMWDFAAEIYTPIIIGKSVDETMKLFSDKMDQYKKEMG